MNILINRTRYRRQRDILQHRPIGITEEMIPFAKKPANSRTPPINTRPAQRFDGHLR